MLLKLIVLLTLVPLVELYLLVQLTIWSGSFWITVGLIVGTGVVGAALARMEGLRVVRSMQEEIGAGRLPTDHMLDGVLILVAGALLLTPGLLTDAAGFLLLIPPSRAIIRRVVKQWARRQMEAGRITFETQSGFRAVHDEPPPGFPPLEDDEARGGS